MTTANETRSPALAKFSATPIIIGVIGFLTLVDLFAAQAILPSLAARFGASPGEIGFAVNASTIGMAVAGVGVVFLGGRVNRRTAVWASLAALSLPTLALAFVSDLTVFTLLRIIQGLFMVTAFSMTMSYLAERCSAAQSATALAAYVTGVVASNLVGRLISGSVTDAAGVPANFVLFAGLNLAGAIIARAALKSAQPMASGAESARTPIAIIGDHLGNACLRTSFAIGFLILFAFIGTFTYVNFVLAAEPIALSPMSLGLVYFVFAPSMITTPLAGRAAAKHGARLAFFASLGLAIAGLPMLLSTSLPLILAGLAIVGVGTFFAQATATGFVGRAAKHDRAAASGLYLSSYYLGGLAGAALLGGVFEAQGWTATVVAIGAALALAGALAATLKRSTAEPLKAAIS
ncbi:MAG: MFS transporter [Parvularculaceae bacterium]|nr:MFS transporter [Parvularculaceae bacterium]